MQGVSGFNADEDIRHERRSLTDEELGRLIEAADRWPDLFGMPSPLRAMAFRLSAATGFRADELRRLTPESFRLDGPEPSIFLRAAATKNRRPADQPIPLSQARDLRAWLRDKPSGRPDLPLHHETAKAIRRDLESAGIPYATDEGMADFHSLRAYYISALVRSGASIKEVQALARHAKAETTLKHYAKVNVRDLRGAVESLPTPAEKGRAPEALCATGTDGPISNRLATHLPRAGDASGRALADTGETV
jgi:integrase